MTCKSLFQTSECSKNQFTHKDHIQKCTEKLALLVPIQAIIEQEVEFRLLELVADGVVSAAASIPDELVFVLEILVTVE